MLILGSIISDKQSNGIRRKSRPNQSGPTHANGTGSQDVDRLSNGHFSDWLQFFACDVDKIIKFTSH
jgi:hypothetical protein